MRLVTRLLPLLILAICAPSSQGAVLLYDYVQSSLIGINYNAEAFNYNRTKMAQRFVTQANGYVVTQVNLNVWTGLPNSGTFTVDIYSDNSNAVGTKVATVGTRDISTIYAPSGSLTPATFSSLNINLATNTSYWVVVESETGVEGSDMYWGHGGSSYVTNPTSAARYNPGTIPQWYTYPNAANPGALGMQVYATPEIQSNYAWAVGAPNVSGTWNTTTANWSGDGSTWVNGTNSNATFASGGASAATTGTITISGTITSGTVSVGAGSDRWYDLRGGSLTAKTLALEGSGTAQYYGGVATTSLNSNVSVGGPTLIGRASLSITGGTFATNRITANPTSPDWGFLALSGSAVVTATAGIDGTYGTTGSNGATTTFGLLLEGGTLSTTYLKVADREQTNTLTNNDAVLMFNGATVRALSSTNSFIQLYGYTNNPTGRTNAAYINARGAVFDTNGFDVTVAVNLLSASDTTLNAASTGGVSKLGAGTLTLSGSNGYYGATTVASGTLLVAHASALGQPSGSLLANGGTLNLGNYGLTRSGTIRFAGGTVQSGTLTNNTVAFDGQAGTVSAVLAGTVGITKTTSGTLTLSASNTFTGLVLVAGGTLALGGSGAFNPAVSVEVNGGGFDIAGKTQTISGLNGTGGTVALGAGSLRIDNATANTYAGSINGTGSLVKSGAGDLVLSGTNTYSGGSTVSAGRLVGTTSSLKGAIANSAAVSFDQSTSGTYSGVMSGTGSLTKLGTGTLSITSLQSFTGPTTISVGALALSGTGGLASSLITVDSGGVLDVKGRSGGLTLASGQTLAGTGTVAGLVLVGTNATVAPGNSPGTLNVGSMEFAVGGNYNWQIYDIGGGAGTGWDFISGTGSLNITAGTVGNARFTVNLWSLSALPDVSGTLAGFNKNYDYRWKLAEFAGGITGFSPEEFLVQVAANNGTGGFQNETNGTFSVAQGDPATFGSVNQLYVVYAAAPEPSTLVLGAAGLASAAWEAWRRRKRAAS